jgi:drug/metabolite transporter (DMT)-like permease
LEKQTRAYLFAAATISFWSTVAAAFKLTLAHVSSEELLLYSTLFSLLILGTIVITSGRFADIRRWPAGEFLRSALLGFLNPFLYYLVLFKAYSLLPAQEALTLNFIWPIVLVLFSIVILRQRITLKTLLAMLVSFSGALVISTRGDVLGFRFTHPLGAGLAMGSSAVWALYWVYGTKDSRDAISRLCMNFFFGFIFVALYMALFSSPRLVGGEGLVGSLYVGAFEMGVTYVVWLYALRLSRTTAQVSNLIYLTPFLSLIVVHLVVGEQIYVSTMVGLFLIVGGILLQHYGEIRSGFTASRAGG